MIPNDYEITSKNKFWNQHVQFSFLRGRVHVSVNFKPRLRYIWRFRVCAVVPDRPRTYRRIETCSGSTWTTLFYIARFWYRKDLVPIFLWCSFFQFIVVPLKFWGIADICAWTRTMRWVILSAGRLSATSCEDLFTSLLILIALYALYVVLSWGIVFLCSVP